MDCVLESTKEQVLEKYDQLKKDKKLKDDAIHKVLAKKAAGKRQQPLYNISKYTFKKLCILQCMQKRRALSILY